MLELVISLFSFFLGAIVGSFLNALVYRIRNGIDFVFERSECIYCKHKLSPLDLVPIFSFIFLRGKCRYCKKNIHLRYFVFEIITGVSFLLYFLYFPFSYNTSSTSLVYVNIIYYLILICIFLYIGLYDYLYYEISDKLILFSSIFVLIYFIYGWFSGSFSFYQIIGNIAVGVAVFMIFLFIILLTKGKGMGGGDMKLVFMIGLILGYPAILYVLFFSFLIGSIVGILLIIIKSKSIKSSIPFAPFLSLSVILYIIFGTYVSNFMTYIFLR